MSSSVRVPQARVPRDQVPGAGDAISVGAKSMLVSASLLDESLCPTDSRHHFSRQLLVRFIWTQASHSAYTAEAPVMLCRQVSFGSIAFG